MKNFFLSLFLIAVLLLPTASLNANSLTPTERQAKLELIQKLLEQVLALKAQLSELKAAGGPVRQPKLYESRFYQDDFEAVYTISDTKLSRIDGKTTRYGDSLLWETYKELVGENFVREYIKEFRVFNDEDSPMGAFIEQKNDLTWLLAVNRLGEDLVVEHDSQFMIELLLHESAHVVFFEDHTYQDEFSDEFWLGEEIERHKKNLSRYENNYKKLELIGAKYYNLHPSDFVTDYAASSPTEDLVESFVEFVITDYPTSSHLKYDKVRFFYEYPELVKWRKELLNSELI